jgi:hypothetical protein
LPEEVFRDISFLKKVGFAVKDAVQVRDTTGAS